MKLRLMGLSSMLGMCVFHNTRDVSGVVLIIRIVI